ncbi:MAG: LytTR family transcriptional regulator DNA-binding domain-containing protein [Ruminococcus sp.]|nr:LytTR family transcriptional regulator DNA-binding domain-containing protein [Ruminococcus sp.]
MKKLKLRFEQDKTLDKIEIIVRAAEKDAQVTALLESLSKDEPVKLTVLDSGNRASVIDEKDIVFVAAEGKLVRVVTTEGIFKAKQSLQSIESILSRTFLRVSRFEIINLKKVRKYDFTLVGTLRVEFDNGMETWASRRYIPLIKERLSGEEGYLC